MRKKVLLSFPQNLLGEPILFKIGHEFEVVPNIKGASVSDEIGLVVLELRGDPEEIEKTLDYLRSREVKVETMETEE